MGQAMNSKNRRSSEWFRARILRILTARLAPLRGLSGGRFRRQTRDRHLQFLERAKQLQRASARRRRGREARRVAAGGLPLEFPTISLGEMYMKPTAMLFRNLMAMDVEESIRANPLDGVVLALRLR